VEAGPVEADGEIHDEADEEEPAPAVKAVETPRTVTIHVPGDELGRDPAEDGAAPGDGTAPLKKRTRRGSRGGKKRRKPAGAAVNGAAVEAGPEVDGRDQVADGDLVAVVEEEPAAAVAAAPAADGEWGYVPMSEWGDELDSPRR